jgi:hypothetical protein
VCITLEFYEEPRGERQIIQMRSIGNFEKLIVEEYYPNNQEAVHTLFLYVEAQKTADFEIEHDMIVISVANNAKIWYNQKDEKVPNFVDYELDHSENHHRILARISEQLSALTT